MTCEGENHTNETDLAKCSQCSHKRPSVCGFMGAPVCKECADLLFHVSDDNVMHQFSEEERKHILESARHRAKDWEYSNQQEPSELRKHAHKTYATLLIPRKKD